VHFGFFQFRAARLLPLAAALVLASLPTAGLAQTPGWQPGPDGVLDNTYDGFIDVPTSGATVPGSGGFTVSGWVADTTAQGWAGIDAVQVFLGTQDSGKMLAQAIFAQSRPDVVAALGNPYWGYSGFVATVQGSDVPAGPQTLSVYAHTPGKGWWFKQVSVNGGGPASSASSAPSASAPAGNLPGDPPTVKVEQPAESANISSSNLSYDIKGSADDPTYGASAIDYVDVWLDGEPNGSGGTELGMVTPGSDGKWTVSFKPTKFKSMHHNLYIFVHSSKTGLKNEIIRGFNITG
jgi:hypothetical protein